MKTINAILLSYFLISLNYGSHNPNVTATIMISGFDTDGPDVTGVYGNYEWDEDWDMFSDVFQIPNSGQPEGIFQPNVITTTEFYGDTPPDYYTPEDFADLDAVMEQYGGGIPRYALILAKFTKHVMEQSGAEQVNFMSGSLGSLITRWMIEKDLENLASEGKIARWWSLAGVMCGHWLASNDLAYVLFDLFDSPTIDVDHMDYDWIEYNLHSPRTEAASPYYGNILMGMLGSTNQHLNDDLLNSYLVANGDPQPNDGVVTFHDSYFHTFAPGTKFLNKNPTMSVYYETHQSMTENLGVWLQAGSFITGRKRVTVKMTQLQVTEIHEPDEIFWDYLPAEVVFQTEAFAPILENIGITDPISRIDKEGIIAPVYEFYDEGETQYIDQIIFDDMLFEDETELNLRLWAIEMDWDVDYDITEPIGAAGSSDEMGETWLTVTVEEPGSYLVDSDDWNGIVEVEIFEYPFVLIGEIAGDLNFDEEVNVTDVIIMVNFILDNVYDYYADMNNDNTVNILDVILLVEIILS